MPNSKSNRRRRMFDNIMVSPVQGRYLMNVRYNGRWLGVKALSTKDTNDWYFSADRDKTEEQIAARLFENEVWGVNWKTTNNK